MANKASQLSDQWMVYAKRAGVFLVFSLDKKWLKNIVILSFVVLAGWMIYGQAWTELVKPVKLPETIANSSIELNIETLRNINTSRSVRVQKPRKNFSLYAKYFEIPAD